MDKLPFTDRAPTCRRRFIAVGSMAVLVLTALLPKKMIDLGPTLCLIRLLGGDWCWGCGMTRACWRFLHGDIEGAVAYNRMVLLVAPLLIFLYARWIWDVIGKEWLMVNKT